MSTIKVQHVESIQITQWNQLTYVYPADGLLPWKLNCHSDFENTAQTLISVLMELNGMHLILNYRHCSLLWMINHELEKRYRRSLSENQCRELISLISPVHKTLLKRLIVSDRIISQALYFSLINPKDYWATFIVNWLKTLIQHWLRECSLNLRRE